MEKFVFLVILLCACRCISSESTQAPSTTPGSASTTTAPPIPCDQKNATTCEACLYNGAGKNVDTRCLFCFTNGNTGKCIDYPVGQIIPRSDKCGLKDARWAVCWLNFEALLISIGVIGGVVLISLCCCVYCCCCRGKSRSDKKFEREMDKIERERERRRMENEQRRNERSAKNDEIRRKYGLMKDDDSSYHRIA